MIQQTLCGSKANALDNVQLKSRPSSGATILPRDAPVTMMTLPAEDIVRFFRIGFLCN